MNIQEILERFALIANLTLEEASPWYRTCEDAMYEIESKLKPNVDKETNGRRLNIAAAALGFYKYVLYRASGCGMDSFSAGDINIKSDKKTSVDMAYKVWQDAKRNVADILEDDNFLFERIEEI